MQLQDVMTPAPDAIEATAHLDRAATMMKKLGVGSLPVTDHGNLIGIITDRDITVRATASKKNPTKAIVRDAMTSEVTCCYEDDDVQLAGRVMEEMRIRRLLVLNRQRQLVGIISLGDLAVSTGPQLGGEVLNEVSKPALPNR